MINLPFEMIPLERWKVYRALLPKGSEVEHRIIIMSDVEDLEFFYITTKIDKARIRTRKDKASLVELSPDEWPECLTVDCCIQCGAAGLESIKKEEVRKLYENGRFLLIGEVPENIKTKIISAICASVSYSPAEKKFYTL